MTQKLSQEEKAEIKQGLKEISEGKVIPLSQLEKQIAEEDLEQEVNDILLTFRREVEREHYDFHYDAQLKALSQIHELYKKHTYLKGNKELPKYSEYYPTTTFTPRYQQARWAAWDKGQLKMIEAGYKSTEEWKK